MTDNSFFVGLTGPIGAGKSSVAEVFLRHGIPIVDADKIAREVVMPDEECLQRLVGEFGNSILLSDGSLDRKKTAEIVFSSKKKTQRLNKITHPFICTRIIERAEQLQKSGNKIVLLDVPLLFESGIDKKCKKNIAVLAECEIRINRILIRDHTDRESALARINAQHNDDYFIERADYIIFNNGEISDCISAAEKLITELKGT